jgi:hypothetical protein
VEIAEYIARRWRLIAALAAVPLVAALVMGGLAAQAGRTYRSELVVAVPSSGEAASARLQAMTDFRELIRTSAVIEAVSDATGQTPRAVRSSLHARQLGLSGLVAVRLDSPSREKVAEGVNVATSKALELLLGGDRTVAEGEVSAADAQIADLTGQLNALAAQAGNPLPRERYEAVLTELSELRVTRAQHQAAGEAGQAEALGASISALEAEEAQLAPIISQADVLNSELEAARAARATAAQQVVVSQNRLDAAVTGLGDPTGPNRVPRRPAILKAATTALVLGTLSAALLLVLVELVSLSRRSRGAPPATPTGNGHDARPESPVAGQPTGPVTEPSRLAGRVTGTTSWPAPRGLSPRER